MVTVAEPVPVAVTLCAPDVAPPGTDTTPEAGTTDHVTVAPAIGLPRLFLTVGVTDAVPPMLVMVAAEGDAETDAGSFPTPMFTEAASEAPTNAVTGVTVAVSVARMAPVTAAAVAVVV
jgi:hypothetical protein